MPCPPAPQSCSAGGGRWQGELEGRSRKRGRLAGGPSTSRSLLSLPAQPGGSGAAAPTGSNTAQQPQAPAGAAFQESLEEDVWKYKPVWCQPWSILSSGTGVVAGVWSFSHGSLGWTFAAALPILAWWWLFLGVMPAQFREYAAAANEQQRRQRQQQARQTQLQQWEPED